MKRLSQLNEHFKSQGTFNTGKVGEKSDDDVVIVSFARTAMTKARRGPQKDTAPEAMLKVVLSEVLKRANNLDAKEVGEVCIGNVNQPGGGATTARMGQFLAGYPDTTPCYAINRFCSSGLQAVADVANSIRAG